MFIIKSNELPPNLINYFQTKINQNFLRYYEFICDSIKELNYTYSDLQSFIMNRPIALVCYICGREFGTKSLAFHIKACQKKWQNEENLKPPKQRRPCPQPPKGFQQVLNKEKITKEDISKFNTQSFDTFVEDALVQCEYCGRRFNPKSLIPHQKACKTNPMIKKPYVNKGPMGKYSQTEQTIKPMTPSYQYKQQTGKYNQPETGGDLVPCRRCGRKFNSDRVDKHQRVCKADPVQVSNKKAPVYQKKFQQPSKLKPVFGKQKKPKWKIQHQEFQNALKAMKQVKAVQARGGKLSDLPPPPPSNYDHYTECRYCGRKYAPDVAERHIPKCANIINKPGGIKPSKIQEKYIIGTGSGANKYTAPTPVVQTKNNINTPFKPNFSTSNSYGKQISGVQIPGNLYGNNSNKYEINQPKTSNISSKYDAGTKYNKNEVESSYSNPFGNNSYQMGSSNKSKPNESYDYSGGSSYKPNLKNNSRTNANKYW